MNNPVGQRVVSVHARCLECDVPSYFPLDDDKEYKIFISTFLLAGGDGYTFSPIEHQKISKLLKIKSVEGRTSVRGNVSIQLLKVREC